MSFLTDLSDIMVYQILKTNWVGGGRELTRLVRFTETFVISNLFLLRTFELCTSHL